MKRETDKEISLFDKLSKVNVNDNKKTKGQFAYLSWSWAVNELLKVVPDAEWEVHEYQNEDGLTVPYMTSGAGSFVKVTVTCDGIERTQVHPVTDNRNNPIVQPTCKDIGNSIQRCLAKAIALHGLGLYIYAGEDLPEPDALNSEQRTKIGEIIKQVGDKSLENDMWKKIDNLEINNNNYEACISKIKTMIKEKK